MKIAWIVPGFSSDEQDWCIPALLDLARVMAARHELHVFALQYPYRRERYSVFGAVVHAIGGGNRGWPALPRAWRALLNEVRREYRRARFDVLHAFWVWEPGVLAAWLRRRLGLRTIVSLAGGELIDLPEIAYGYGGRRWLMRAMRWAMWQADVVTAGSQGLIEKTREVVNLDGERLAFAPLGVDVEMFSPEGRQPEGRHRSPSLRHRNPQELLPSIVNVGSLQAVKGQADLIRAFRFVVDREPKARLAIVGGGPLRTNLEALARQLDLADRMSFAGDVRHERLPETYRAASVYVQSSLHEAQGMAVLEAAACGLPIVGTPVGALADLAPEAALTSPCGDPLRLAQAILSVLGDAARRRALGEAARTRVEQVYSLETAADRFEALYQS